MNKVFFILTVVLTSAVLYSCEPAHKETGESAPSNFNEGAEYVSSEVDHTSVAATDTAMVDTTKK